MVLRPGQHLEPERIREHCRERLARYKVPRDVRIVPALPLSPQGKILKRGTAPALRGERRPATVESRMKPVKAVDAAFLQLETAATPMHVGALFVLDPPSRQAGRTFFRRFKLLIAARLDRSEVFTRRVAALPFNAANPMWLAGRADLDYHVRRTVLPEPGSQHQLEECVADLHTPLMDRERPLWELHVIEGLEGGRVALYVKTHHAGLDGASAQLFLRSFVDTVARPARRSTRPPRPAAG